MPDDDEPDHRRSAAPAPAYADPDLDLDSDLDSIPPRPISPSHPPLPRLTTTTSGSPVRSITQTFPPKGLQSPIGFGSPPQDSSSRNPDERQLISRPQTPPNNPQRARNHYLQHGSRSPSPSPSSRHLPPPAASTLYHLVGGLGLGPSSPLSPFRRQFSAPLQAVRSSSRAPSFSFASIAGSRPSTGYGTGSGSGTFFTHVNDSRGTVHHLTIKDDDTNHSIHADDELSDDEQQNQHPRVRVNTHTAAAADDNLTQDSKDVLVERLTDLIHHLQGAKDQTTVTNQSVLSDVSIGELHAKVDEMEAVITGRRTGREASKTMKRPIRPSARRSRKRQEESERESESENDEDEEEEHPHSPLKDMLAFASSAAAAAAPSWLAKSFSGSEPSPPESRTQSPSPSSKVHLKLAEAAKIKPSAAGTGGMAAAVSVAKVKVDVEAKKRRDVEETERIAAEADKLAAQLEVVLKSLETRREESNVSSSHTNSRSFTYRC